jgi:hypothetical protein
MALDWLALISDLSDDRWWSNASIEHVAGRGRGKRWKLTDDSKTDFQMAIAPVATGVSGEAYQFSVDIVKSTTAGAAALVRLTVKESGGADQYWDAQIDPHTGEFLPAKAEGQTFGAVEDLIDTWRVTVICLAHPRGVSDVQAALAPAIGKKVGKYQGDAMGTVQVQNLRFERLPISAFLASAAAWNQP